jgi:hypothetical protein
MGATLNHLTKNHQAMIRKLNNRFLRNEYVASGADVFIVLFRLFKHWHLVKRIAPRNSRRWQYRDTDIIDNDAH